MRPGKGGCYGWAIYAYKDKFGVVPSGKIDWAARCPVGDEVKRYITYRNIRHAKSKAKFAQNTPDTVSQVAEMAL
jgi:hypothetical protein